MKTVERAVISRGSQDMLCLFGMRNVIITLNFYIRAGLHDDHPYHTDGVLK